MSRRGAGDQLDDDHGGCVVAGVLAGEGRVGEDAGAEEIVGVEPRLAGALVDHLLEGHHAVGGGRLPLDLHADLDECGDDAGVLADGAMALGAHAGVDEDLRDGVLGGVRLLVLVGAGEVGDVIDGVVEADVLQRVGYAADYVVLADDGHRGPRIILGEGRLQTKMRVGGQGRIVGERQGEDCRGGEKMRLRRMGIGCEDAIGTGEPVPFRRGYFWRPKR